MMVNNNHKAIQHSTSNFHEIVLMTINGVVSER